MTIAYAHAGEVHSTQNILLDWTFSDPFLWVFLLLTVFYVRGWRRYRRAGSSLFPAWRLVSWLAGFTLLFLALASPIDAVADRMYTGHMLQHLLLGMVAPPLLLLGAPFLAVTRGLPGVIREGVFIPMAQNRIVRGIVLTATKPLVAFAFLQSTFVLWHIPTFYDLALLNTPAHYLEHFMMGSAGALFWWNIVHPFPFRYRLTEPMRLLFLLLATIVNSAMSSIISFAEEPLYAYSDLGGLWGIAPHYDQQTGGIIMWISGGMMYLLAFLLTFLVLARKAQLMEPPTIQPGGDHRGSGIASGR